MRTLAAAITALALAPAGAAAQTGGAGPGLDGSGTGGASTARPIRAHVSARLLAVTPATARPVRGPCARRRHEVTEGVVRGRGAGAYARAARDERHLPRAGRVVARQRR